MGLLSLCIAVTLVALASCASTYNEKLSLFKDVKDPHPGSGFKDPHGIPSGYPSPGYGSHDPHKSFSSHRSYLPVLSFDSPPNELDKLRRRVDIVREGVKAQAEEVDSLAAKLSIQEKKLMELTTIIFADLTETDSEQDHALDKNDKHHTELHNDIEGLSYDISHLGVLNIDNSKEQVVVEGEWATEQQRDTEQSRDIYALNTLVRSLKDKLFQVQGNTFAYFSDTVERTARTLKSVKTQETRRMCEVGVVTIYTSDAHQEQMFKTWFESTPQTIWGTIGFHFDREDPHPQPSFGYGYPPPSNPETLGYVVYAYSTKRGIHFQLVDYTFGATSLHSVDVKYQSCSLGTGIDSVDH